MDSQQPYAGTQTGACRKHRGSRHSLRTGYQQGPAEVSLVRKLAAYFQHRRHIPMFRQCKICLFLIDSLLAQADIQQLPFTHELFVLGKKESQLRQLQA